MPPPPAPSTWLTPPVARNLPMSGLACAAAPPQASSAISAGMMCFMVVLLTTSFGHDDALHRRQLGDQLVRHAAGHLVLLHRDLQVLGQRVEHRIGDLHILVH